MLVFTCEPQPSNVYPYLDRLLTDCLQDVSQEDRMTLRTIAIDQVLNTDMKKHFSVLSRFQVSDRYTVFQLHGMLQDVLLTACIQVSPQYYSQEEVCFTY